MACGLDLSLTSDWGTGVIFIFCRVKKVKTVKKTSAGKLSLCAVIMPDSSSHLSVCWVCVWPSLCDSLITQHRETGNAGSASEDA